MKPIPANESENLPGQNPQAQRLAKVDGGFAVAIALLSLVIPAVAVDRTYWCSVDDHVRPIEFYYNNCGGDRGVIGNLAEVSFSQSSPTVYRMQVNSVAGTGLWTSVGRWYALGHVYADHRNWNPGSAFHPMIKPAYQPRLTKVRIKLAGAASPGGRSDLLMKVELKGLQPDGSEVLRHLITVDRNTLLIGPFPKTLEFDIPGGLAPVGLLNVVLDRAVAGDRLDMDDLDFQVAMADQPVNVRATVLLLGSLLGNWNEATAMVDDRSNFPTGVFENVTATAKLAKLIAMGVHMGSVEETPGRQAIDKIAQVLLNVVPRGPSGVNALWPHFTTNGGTLRHPDSEWASGDTAYAVADLAVALRMIGDPNGRLPSLKAMIQGINWNALLVIGYYRHGYDKNGSLSLYDWRGFGMETMGVNLVALAGGGPLAGMLPAPSDNGSGFIIHAAYPVPFMGTDRYGNRWRPLRREEIYRQVNWYRDSAHANPFLVAAGLFGLSAAENPLATDYVAFGIGGRFSGPNDGGASVVTPHYCGMIASLDRANAQAMFESLEDDGFVTPLNSVESMSVDPATGAQTSNWLKGSWNLALFAEGWMFADSGAARAAYDALQAIPEFARALNTLFPRAEEGEDIICSDGQALLLLDPNQSMPEQTLTTGAPFTTALRPSRTASRLLFDAHPATGSNTRAKIFSCRLEDIGLGVWTQHTTDPFGAAEDIAPVGQFSSPGVSWLTDRTGVLRHVFEFSGTYGPGSGFSMAGNRLGGAAFSKVPGEGQILFTASASVSSSFEKADINTRTVVATIPFDSQGTTLGVERLDAASDGRLLISATDGLRVKSIATGELVLVTATGRQGAWSANRKRVVFTQNGDVFVADISLSNVLSSIQQVTATPARAEGSPVFVASHRRSDYDSDGLADAAETITDWQNPDTDGDGQTDGAEALAGTSPTDPQSRFIVTEFSMTFGGAVISWSSVPGYGYVVEKCIDLGAGAWLPISGIITAASPSSSFSISLLSGEAKAFYRVKLER